MYKFQGPANRIARVFRILSSTVSTVSRMGSEPGRRATVSAPGGLATRDLSQGDERTFRAEE